MINPMYLAHYGIKGQKWGVRRFQNEDGSLTSQGKTRYLGEMAKAAKSYMADRRKNVGKYYKRAGGTEDLDPSEMTKQQRAKYDKANKQYKKDQETAKKKFLSNISDINERRKTEKNIRKLQKLKKEAKIGRDFDPIRTGVNAVIGDRIGGLAATIGASLASSASGVAMSNEEIAAWGEVGRAWGRTLGIGHTTYQMYRGARARQILYGDSRADPWFEEHKR